jgi:hypothetical protein
MKFKKHCFSWNHADFKLNQVKECISNKKISSSFFFYSFIQIGFLIENWRGYILLVNLVLCIFSIREGKSKKKSDKCVFAFFSLFEATEKVNRIFVGRCAIIWNYLLKVFSFSFFQSLFFSSDCFSYYTFCLRPQSNFIRKSSLNYVAEIYVSVKMQSKLKKWKCNKKNQRFFFFKFKNITNHKNAKYKLTCSHFPGKKISFNSILRTEKSCFLIKPFQPK